MNYLRSPGMSPDFLYWICDVHNVFHYLKWSLPLSMELVCFSHLVLSAVECSIVLNLQFERLCVLCPYHMDLSADASYMYLETLPHIKICSFSPILKDTDKL